MQKVVIYTGPMCNYCSAAKHLLNKKKVNYTEYDIAVDPSKMQEMQKKQMAQEPFLKFLLEILMWVGIKN